MLLNPITYHSPRHLEDAITLLTQHPDAKLLAGGTILINTLKSLKRRQLKTPSTIISLKRVKELHGIKIDNAKTVIPAMTTLEEILSHQGLTRQFSLLRMVAQNIATTQLRNMATIGGNIASRYTWAEMNTCLLALDATLSLTLTDKKTVYLSMQDFLLKGGRLEGILTNISLENKNNILAVYQRIPKCTDVDIPLAAVCIKAESRQQAFSQVRVVINTGMTFPQRDKRLEHAIEHLNLSLDRKTMLASLPALTLDQKLGEYRVKVLQAITQQALSKLIAIYHDAPHH